MTATCARLALPIGPNPDLHASLGNWNFASCITSRAPALPAKLWFSTTQRALTKSAARVAQTPKLTAAIPFGRKRGMQDESPHLSSV
jgi:hypothetical protein